jgi:hypothetical protein
MHLVCRSMTIGIRFPSPAGLLRESVLHRYAQFCHLVRERLLIHYLNQPVNIRDLSSGGRGRKFKSSHPDHFVRCSIDVYLTRSNLSELPAAI